jgi:ankyrin repeat protein
LINKNIGGLQDVVRIAQKQLEIQEDTVKQKLSDKEEECLQLFRLTHDTKDTTYEWYKGHVKTRVEGTCEWFLNHENFLKWLEEDSGPLLVSADPGCGKSVLAKYLIDERLPRSSTICYFFFKDKDQDTARQALCALLHQLFSKRPSLIKHAIVKYGENGQGIMNSTNLLWDILWNAVQDPQVGPVIIVLDALDECAESEFEDLIRNIESQFRDKNSGQSNIKFLLTSRPYEQIVCKFTGMLESFPNIRIPGEEESDIINREVNCVIQYRVEQLAKEKRLSDPVKNHLVKRLLGIRHRTYLWVYLVFDYLTKENFKKTTNGVDSILTTLPFSIYDAYERILNKSKKDPMVRRALSIILVATRPLRLCEMNVALNVHGRLRSIYDLDLEEEEDFRSRLRDWCGLFISIHRNKVDFLHQTAREFLLAQAVSPAAAPSESRWRHSITSQSAHNILAEVCVNYLDFLNNGFIPTDARTESPQNIDTHAFLVYSARNWVAHYQKACIGADAALLPPILRLCSPDSKSRSAWLSNYWGHTSHVWTKSLTSLMISSLFGLEAVVMVLLANGDELDSRDHKGMTPLSSAAANGHDRIVKLLLEKGADFDSRDKDGRTPLSYAAKNGHDHVVKLLLKEGADFDSRNEYGWTPLSYAATNGHETIVKLLLEKGAAFDSSDDVFRTPLSNAARNGHDHVVKLLLKEGADFDSRDKCGWTPLSNAAKNGHDHVVKLLLKEGADFESKEEDDGRTPLSYAAGNGHETIVKLLLEKGAAFDSSDDVFRTPLSYAAENGYRAIVMLLLEKGADFDSRGAFVLRDDHDPGDDCDWTQKSPLTESQEKFIVKQLREIAAALSPRDDPDLGDDCDWTQKSPLTQSQHKFMEQFFSRFGVPKSGRTPLSFAAENGHENIVKILLERGAEFKSIDIDHKMTALLYAAENGHENIVKLLLENGANFDSRDHRDMTSLSEAFKNGHDHIVTLLLENGAEFDPEDEEKYQTPLLWAAENGDEAIVKLLLEKGANFDSRDHEGGTPLSWAAENGHEAIVKLLLEKGANFDSRDYEGGTPLSWAAENGHEAIVKLLLEKGANFDSRDHEGRTPLSWAAENGHETIVRLLLEKGADSETKDKVGRSPLSWATENGHEAIVKLLLMKGANTSGNDKRGNGSH